MVDLEEDSAAADFPGLEVGHVPCKTMQRKG